MSVDFNWGQLLANGNRIYGWVINGRWLVGFTKRKVRHG